MDDGIIRVVGLVVGLASLGLWFRSKDRDDSPRAMVSDSDVDIPFKVTDGATLVRAITRLIDEKGLNSELKVDAVSVPGHFIWGRSVLGVKRMLRIAPISDPPKLRFEYGIHWWTERQGEPFIEGKWLANLELTLEAFERFLIVGGDFKDLSARFLDFLQD